MVGSAFHGSPGGTSFALLGIRIAAIRRRPQVGEQIAHYGP
jgi:hypothetical protein